MGVGLAENKTYFTKIRLWNRKMESKNTKS